MTGSVYALPYGHRCELNGTWSVFYTRSGETASSWGIPKSNLTELKAKEVAAILNRYEAPSLSCLHRYAIQGLPGRH